MRGKCAGVLLTFSILTLLARPDDPGALESWVKARYEGRTVTFRKFYSGELLRFDDGGNLIGPAVIGPWTTSGRIEVTRVSLDKQTLTLRARRLLLRYDRDQQKLVDVGGQIITKGPLENLQLRRTLSKLQDLQLELLVSRDEKLGAALARIFLSDGEKLADVAPAYWKHFLEGGSSRQDQIDFSDAEQA